jgi:hypothetical protein
MGRDVRNVGKSLVATGIGVGIFGYLIATVAAGGRHPIWPYFLFGGVSVVGAIIFLAARGEGAVDAAKGPTELGESLRLAATARGFTADQVRTRVTGPWSATDVDQFLAGERRPDWAFVQAFAQLVTGNNRWRRADLERQIRPRWEAAASRGSSTALRRPNRAVRRVTGGIVAAAVLAVVAVILAVILPSRGSSPSVAAAPPTCTTAATLPTTSASNQLNQPDAIAVDGAHVWVANFGSSTVTELNASNGSLVRVLSDPADGFDHPRAIAVAGSHVWVANANTSTVTELNANDGSLVKIISGFAGPNGIATTSTGVWVTSYGESGGASVIELSAQNGNQLLPVIAGNSYKFSRPDAIAVDGAHVWVANFGSSTVTELNASNGSLVRVLSSQVPLAVITDPASGTNLATPETIHAAGTVQHLQPGHHLLLFLQWQDKDGSWQPTYWAGDLPVPVASNGSWTGSVCLGFAVSDGGAVRVWLVDLGPKGYNVILHIPLVYLKKGFPKPPDSLAPDVRMLTYSVITTGPSGPGCKRPT